MTDPHRNARDIQPAPPAAAPLKQAGPLPLKVVVVFLSVLALVISGMGYYTIGRLGSEVASATNLDLGGGSTDTLDGAVDILLIGTDSRTDAQGNTLSDEELDRLNAGSDEGEENTDTIMVIRVPADGSRATAVSIPRDTYVNDDEFGNMKINGIYAAYKEEKAAEMEEDTTEDYTEEEIHEASTEAGRSGLINMIGDLTGTDIDHYAEVGLHGFVLLTDAVGGVDVCLNDAVDDPYSGANFPAGEQTLDGFDALAFVRQRHGLPRGDLDRIVRQQAFMASLVNQVLSTGTLTNPARLSEMSAAVERSVVLDENWDVVSFANQLADLAGGNVTFTTIPVTSVDGTGDYGESIITIDPNEVNTFFDDMVITEEEEDEAASSESAAPPEEENELAPELKDATISVLNAGGMAGLASSVTAYLEERGMTVESTSNAQPGIYWSSQIVAADPNSPGAQALAEELGGLEVTANESLDPDTFVVVAYDDYHGPTSEPPEGQTDDAAPSEQVGTPGADFGQAEVGPEIDAGGDGPRCIN